MKSTGQIQESGCVRVGVLTLVLADGCSQRLDGASAPFEPKHPTGWSDLPPTFRNVEAEVPNPKVRDWKSALTRTLAGGLGTVLALAAAGWPDDATTAALVAFAGLVLGLAAALGLEYVVRLRSEVERLRNTERELDAEKKMRAEERKLREEQLMLAKREAAVAAVDIEVWGGAYNEAAKTGHIVPLEAILARRENLLKAKNLHIPLPPS